MSFQLQDLETRKAGWFMLLDEQQGLKHFFQSRQEDTGALTVCLQLREIAYCALQLTRYTSDQIQSIRKSRHDSLNSRSSTQRPSHSK